MANSKVLEIVIKAKDEASKTLGKFSKSLKDNEKLFKGMSVAGGVALAGIGAGLTSAISQSVKLNESVNAVNVIFGKGADNILEFGKTASKSIGIANSEFNQMATMTGALLKDTGKPMQEVADITVDLSKRAADLASVFNTDVSDAMSAINQAIRGETEAIRRYAGDVTDASLQNYLLSQGINTSTTELTDQEKRLYRVQLIMEQTKATAGDFANTSGELANQQRILKAEIANLSAQIGTEFQPILKSVLSTLSPILSSISEWVQKNPELTRNIIIVAVAIAGLVTTVGLLGFLLPSIMLGFTALISPIGLVVGALSLALIPVILLLIQHWDTLKTGAKTAFTNIGETIYFFTQAAKTNFNTFLLWIQVWWNDMKQGFKDMIDNVLGVFDPLFDMLDKLKSTLSNVSSRVKSVVSSAANKIRGRAVGGGVQVGQPYLVGEKGPELFTPSGNGSIIPNNKLAGAGGNITININGGTYLSEEVAENIGDMIIQKFKRVSRF